MYEKFTKQEIEEARKDPKKRIVEDKDGNYIILEKLEG